jgi:PilZ domain
MLLTLGVAMNFWSQWLPIIDEGRGAQRHSLIWKGVLRHDDQSTDVKVRNVSTTGAMVQSPIPVRVGSESQLELSNGVSIPATVQWAVGDQAGLSFHIPFDIALLAKSKPIAVQQPWAPPVYLDRAIQTAWERRVRRLSPAQLREELESFMKR